jgi:hypothetical protein
MVSSYVEKLKKEEETDSKARELKFQQEKSIADSIAEA